MAFSVAETLPYLKKAHEENRLAHAYLITGPEKSCEELALSLITYLTNSSKTSLTELESEFIRIFKPSSKSRRITIDQIRKLELFLHRASGKKIKVGILLDADRMVREAENAFLKTLEEPPQNSFILLLTAYPDQLLDTILSRCISIQLKDNQSLSLTKEQQKFLECLSTYSKNGNEGIAPACMLKNRFSDLLQSIKEKITNKYATELKKDTETYKKTTEGDWLKQRENEYKALIESEYLKERGHLLKLLLAWFGDAVKQKLGVSSALDLSEEQPATLQLAERDDFYVLINRLTALEELCQQLETNVNESLALEVAFLKAFS